MQDPKCLPETKECPPDTHEVFMPSGSFCCANGDATCCDKELDATCPDTCDWCDVRRTYVRAMHSYLPDGWFDSLRIDWSVELNWLDLYICQVSDDDATNFTECLNTAEDQSQDYVIACFNKFLPDWADYVNQFAAI